MEGFLTGLHKSPFRGFSVEFADYRAYNIGESTRYIDWKLLARTDKLFIKNFEQETNLRCLLLLDNSASMLFPMDGKHYDLTHPNKLIFSIEACAALVAMLYKQRDAFALGLAGEGIEFLSDTKSNFAHKRFIFTKLEQLLGSSTLPKQQTRTKFSQTLHELSNKLHRRSLVVIFTDLLGQDSPQEWIQALQHLRYNQHEVLLFNVIDKRLERELEFSSRPYKFIDAETKEVIKLNPAQLKKEYNALIQSRLDQIQKACNNIGIDFVDCDINQSLDQILMAYFLKRTRLK